MGGRTIGIRFEDVVMRGIKTITGKAFFFSIAGVVLATSLVYANFDRLPSRIKDFLSLHAGALEKSIPKPLFNNSDIACVDKNEQSFSVQQNNPCLFSDTRAKENKPVVTSKEKKAGLVQYSSSEINDTRYSFPENNSYKNESEIGGSKIDSRKLRIITSSLPNAVVAEKYFVKFEAIDGKSPYEWDLLWGRLPEGIYFDIEEGVLSGVPVKGELCVFTVKVMDSKDCAACKSFDLAVLKESSDNVTSGKELNITTKSLPPAMTGKDYYEQITAQGGVLPYKWSITGGVLPKNLSLHKESGILSGVPQGEGKDEFVLGVTDARGNFAEKKLDFVIQTSPLYITTGSLPDGSTGIFYYQKMEAQGGFPPYRWQIMSGALPEGINFDSENVFLSGVPLRAQKTVFKIKALDDEGNYDIAEFSINIEREQLEITNVSLDKGMVGESYYALLSAKGGVPPYSWSTASQFPEGLSLNSETGAIAGTPSEGCDFKLNFSARDSAGTKVSKNLELIILNEPLSIKEPLSFNLHAGENFYSYLTAAGGCPPYVWEVSAGKLPAGMSLDKETGLLQGAPLVSDKNYTDIKVSDKYSESVSAGFYFEVTDERFVIKTEAVPSMKKDENCAFYFEAEGGSPPYKWKIKSGVLPQGLSLNQNGLLSGSPHAAGSFKIGAEVTDYSGKKVSSEFILEVPDNSFFIKTYSLPEGLTDVEYNFQFEAEGGAEPYIWRVVSGGLPQGINLGENTGILKGVPSLGQKIAVTIEAEDKKGQKAQKNFVIKISGEALDFVTAELAEGKTGLQYNQRLTARGGIYPYSWKIVSGFLPGGLMLDAQNGLISGVPLEKFDDVLQIEARDSEGDSRRAVFNLRIIKDTKPLAIITADVSLARINKYYEVELKAEGGEAPYAWFLTGSLPKGFSFDGIAGKISGTAKGAGEFSLNINVKDKDGVGVSKNITLSVKDAPSGVTNFIACASDGKAGLAWVNSADFDVVKIFRNTGDFARTPDEGALIYEGKEDNIVDRNLTNGTIYYYSAFVFDEEGFFSSFSENSSGTVVPQAVNLSGEKDPFVDEVVSFNPLAGDAYGAGKMPRVVLGAPRGTGTMWGSADVVSLNAKANIDGGASAPYGGNITLKFTDNIVVNEAGPDFTIFENAFFIGGNPEARWMEPAVVEVSQDGKKFYRFKIDFVPHYNGENINCNNPYCYSKGFAGINPVYSNNGFPDPRDPAVSGGDSFDLSDITAKNLKWINYVRVISTGDNWITDCNGDKVRHSDATGALSGEGSSGFDLDGVCAVHY
ncbi:MAG: putative Ig domain-containing protein [Candidatus Omnitrophota bacterium]